MTGSASGSEMCGRGEKGDSPFLSHLVFVDLTRAYAATILVVFSQAPTINHGHAVYCSGAAATHIDHPPRNHR
eukprot:16454-Eustigmatos_ZCMA.PRE.1